MWKPDKEHRPRCKWPDHTWLQLGYHLGFVPYEGAKVYALDQCANCGRLNVHGLDKEIAND